MRFCSTALFVLALAAPVTAQSIDAPEAVVKALFDGMRARDTLAMRATMHPAMRLVATSTNAQGAPLHRVVPVANWMRGIAGAQGKTDERIYDPEVRIDGNLATVWTRYDFFLGDNFSHCGYDAFQLVQLGGKWQILQVADTGRRTPEECGRGTAPKVVPAPTPADTAAVIAVMQKLFDAIASRDSAAAQSVFIDGGQILGLQPAATEAHPLTGAAWAGQLSRITAQGQLREVMFKPEIRIADNLAQVWTYYDFYIGDRRNHCGIDTAQLVRTPDGWKIAMISYTTRQTDCVQP